MATKVILTQDVEHLGTAGTVQTVKEGFARNYLLPKKLAEIATPGSIKQVQERQAAFDKRLRKQEDELRSLGDRIAATTLTFTARVGDQGRLFGSITAQEIATELSRAVGEDVDRRKIALDEPIRSIGEHKVPVRLVGRLIPDVTVVVKGEGDDEAVAPAAAADDQPDQPEPPEA
jgi:large subunit ribosomal protein L9